MGNEGAKSVAASDATRSADEALLKAAQEGDTLAFQELITPHADTVRRLARSYAKNWQDADDMAQEALVRAFRSIAQFRGEAALSTWLYRITRNTCLDWYRSRIGKAPQRETEEPTDIALSSGRAPERLLRQKRRVEDLRKVVDELDPKYRAPLVLYELEGMTYEQIAEIEGIPVGTVRSRLNRAREKLAQSLKEITMD